MVFQSIVHTLDADTDLYAVPNRQLLTAVAPSDRPSSIKIMHSKFIAVIIISLYVRYVGKPDNLDEPPHASLAQYQSTHHERVYEDKG